MALISPGVQVTVIDESFYTPAEPGTTPLIVIATAENKSNAASTGTAAEQHQQMLAKHLRLPVNENLLIHTVFRSLKKQLLQAPYMAAKETNTDY